MPCAATLKVRKLNSRMTFNCCIRDGGRSSEFGVQALGSNHLKWLWPKTTVISVQEKLHLMQQVRVMKINENESLLTCRESLNDAKTKRGALGWDKAGGYLVTEPVGVPAWR